MEKLTPQEEQAMQAIWKTGESNVKAFWKAWTSRFRRTPPWLLPLKIWKKGYLSSRLVGNVYLYKPVVSEISYKNKFMSNVVKNYFANSYKELVNFFVQQKKLSASELKEIMDLIEKKSK